MISNDWDIDYANTLIQHIDGVLSYGSGSGTQPAVGQYVLGGTSGAVGRVIARTGDETSGTVTLTDTVGQFASGETLTILSELDFDTVNNGGFTVGDNLINGADEIDVRALEYNFSGDGVGTIFGVLTGSFAENDQLDIDGGTANVALAAAASSSTTFSATTSTALVVPGTTNENNSVIIHYDGGTIDIPEDAKVADTSGGTGAVGYAQRVYGSTTTGSIRLIDSDTTSGSWTNDNGLYILDVVFYDALVAGKVFSVGDIVKGGTSTEMGCVLAVIDDGDDTGKLIMARKTGTFTNGEELQIKVSGTWTKYAEVENTTDFLLAATMNIPGGVRSIQRASQGGIYPSASLNIVRSSNAFYTYVMSVMQELGQLDDKMPIRANVKEQLYTIINGWRIPDLSFRFLEKGSWQDVAKANIWTDYQSQGLVADIGNHGFFYSTDNPTPQPNLYIEQDGMVLRQDWLEGHVDVNIKVKSSTDPRYISPSVPTLGQLIDGGVVLWYCREYLRTYSHTSLNKVGGVAVVSLGTEVDKNNTTGTHQMTVSAESGDLVAGEEITGGTSGAIGIVTVYTSATHNLQYVLKTATNFSAAETITGQVSGKTCTAGAPSSLVAGYGTNIRVMTVDRYFSESVAPSGDFYPGETLTQSGSSWEGYFMSYDPATSRFYVQDANTETPGVGQITGGSSSETFTPSGDTTSTVVTYDLGDGSGWEEYTAAISGDLTGGSAQGIWECYEWVKYLTRKESTAIQGGPGSTTDGVEGRIYRGLYSTWAEVIPSPWGSFAGAGGVGKMFGARGVFIIKETLDSADIQNFYNINNNGDTRTPPNLQVIMITVPEAGVDASAYRAPSEGSSDILRNEFQVGAVGGDYNGASDTKLLVKAGTRSVSPIPADVPNAGTVLVLSPNDTGNYIHMTYSAVDRTNNWFQLTGTIGSFLTGAGETSTDLVEGDYTHVALVEGTSVGTYVSNTIQFLGTIYVTWVARKTGFEPAEGTTNFTATGANIASNMRADDIVNLP